MSDKKIHLDDSGIPIMTRSMLEASECGFRLNEVYNKGMNDSSLVSRRGSAYHAVKAAYVKRLAAANVEMDAEEATLAFQEGIVESKCPPQLVAEVRNIFDRHVQHFTLDRQAYHSTEDRVVRRDAPVPYILEADLIYIWTARNEVEVQDDKTYYVGFSEAHARELLQTRYYVWAAMQECPGFQTYRFTYNFVRLNTCVSVTFDASDFDMLDREIRAWESSRRERYAKQDWEAVPGDVCAFCSLDCPVMDDPRRVAVRVNTPDSFQMAAGRLLVMKKEMKALTASLKSYATVEGAQDVNGEVFAFRPSVSKSYPVFDVVDAMRQRNVALPVYISGSALKPAFKVAPDLVRDLALVEASKTTNRFGSKSVKADTKTKKSDDDEGDDE